MLTIRYLLPVPDASTPDINYTLPVTRLVLTIRYPLSVPDLRRY
jgi:hypothetical protein